MRKSIQFVISSPSGCGKTTVAHAILKQDKKICRSVSYTTRKKREGEIDATDYYFTTKEKFEDMIKQDMFLEYAKVFDHYYGTPRSNAQVASNNDLDIMYIIDWQGGLELMDSIKKDTVSIFLLPPSIQELKQRLDKRALDSQDAIEKRLSIARMESSHCTAYDYVIINDNLEECIKKIQSIIDAERAKTKRQDLRRILEGL